MFTKRIGCKAYAPVEQTGGRPTMVSIKNRVFRYPVISIITYWSWKRCCFCARMRQFARANGCVRSVNKACATTLRRAIQTLAECVVHGLLYAPVPLRPAVLRFIPEPPGSSRFMDRDVPGENDVFLPKNLDGRPSRPSRPGNTPGHPGSSR